MIKLDLQSRIPLYEQLEEQIIRLSLLGVLDEHEQLPSVRALARDVGVNPNTVAKAYQELERQALSCLKTSALIDKQSTIIIEASLETSFDYLESMGFLMEKNKQYKTNRHVFVYRGE